MTSARVTASSDRDDDDDHVYTFQLPSGSNYIRFTSHENSDEFRDLIHVVQLIAQDAQNAVTDLKAQLATERAARAASDSALDAQVNLITSVMSVDTTGGEGTTTPTTAGVHRKRTAGSCATITLFGNVRVISGNQTSDGASCGNVLTGYNQKIQDISGSHNLIVSAAAESTATGPSPSNTVSGAGNIVMGLSNTVQQRFGIVAGQANTQSGADFTSILGGLGGAVSAKWGAIISGVHNTVSGAFGVAITGNQNIVGGPMGVAVSGVNNTDNGADNVIVDGNFNFVDLQANFSVILGGKKNNVSDTGFGEILDGQSGFVNQTEGVIVDGNGIKVESNPNSANAVGAVVVNGVNNLAVGLWAVEVGGQNNFDNGTNAVIVAGKQNNLFGSNAVIVAGTNNTVSGQQSVDVGGNGNTIGAGGANSVILIGNGTAVNTANLLEV